MKTRSCENCMRRMFRGWPGIEFCMDYEMACSEKECEETAENCPAYEEGTPPCLEEGDRYTPSASGRDYGPTNPWNAPGMSIRDFI